MSTSSAAYILVPDFLTERKCQELIDLSERRGYVDAGSDYPPSYRNNDRHAIESQDLAGLLAERLRAHAPACLVVDGTTWEYAGINERFRFCRYQAGQRFNVHQDGVHHRNAACRSHLTFLVYLTDGSTFSGGDTVFYSHGPAGDSDEERPREVCRVRPRMGSLLLFDHALWHAGDEVAAGIKHVLRGDVLYRSATMAAIRNHRPRHDGYVWILAGLDGGWSASGGRDATILIWNDNGQAMRELRGHEQSVLGLAPLSGRRLASVSRDRSLRIWNWSTGTCETSVVAHDSAVLDVIELPDGRLATGGADGLVKLWGPDGSAVGTINGHGGWVWQLALLGNECIASASEDGSVRIWNSGSLRCVDVLEGDQPLRTLLVVDDEIWTGDITGHVTRWAPDTTGRFRSSRFRAHRAAIRRLRQVGDGMVASCGEDLTLRILDSATGAQLFETRHENFVTDALRQGDALLSCSYDGRILRHEGWQLATALRS